MKTFPEQHMKSGEVENARVIDYFCPSSPIPPLMIVSTPKTPLGEGRGEDEINCVYGATEGNAPCDSCHKGIRRMSPYCPPCLCAQGESCSQCSMSHSTSSLTTKFKDEFKETLDLLDATLNHYRIDNDLHHSTTVAISQFAGIQYSSSIRKLVGECRTLWGERK